MTFAGPGNGSAVDVTGPGQTLTISLKGYPGLLQNPFQIMTERFEPVAHTISVATLAGHPLAGWRYWRVYSIGTNDVVIETGAYDQPGPGPMNYIGYYVAQYRKGGRSNGPLLKGHWDHSGDFTQYILNNVCQSTSCS
jgi:hypothetical protein